MSGARRFDWRRMPAFRLHEPSCVLWCSSTRRSIVLVVYAFNDNRVALLWSGFSLRWFAKALANADLRRAAMNSLDRRGGRHAGVDASVDPGGAGLRARAAPFAAAPLAEALRRPAADRAGNRDRDRDPRLLRGDRPAQRPRQCHAGACRLLHSFRAAADPGAPARHAARSSRRLRSTSMRIAGQVFAAA